MFLMVISRRNKYISLNIPDAVEELALASMDLIQAERYVEQQLRICAFLTELLKE